MIEIHEVQLALLVDGLLDISSYGVAIGNSKIRRMADETLEKFYNFADEAVRNCNTNPRRANTVADAQVEPEIAKTKETK